MTTVSKFLLLALVCLGLGTAIYHVAAVLDMPAYHDAPIVHFATYRMLNGDIPYRDFLEPNLPATYFIHWLIWLLFDSNDIGIMLFDLLTMGAFCAYLYLLFGKECQFASILICCLLLSIHYTYGPMYFLQRDVLMFPFLTAMAYYAYRAALWSQKRDFILFGSCTAFACLIKPVALALALLFLLTNGHRYRLKGVFYAICGGLIVGTPFLLTMLATDSLVPFFEMLIHFLGDYSNWDREDLYKNLSVWKTALFLSALFSLSYYFNARCTQTSQRFLALGLLLAYSILHFAAQKGWPYHTYFSQLLFIAIALYLLFFLTQKITKNSTWAALSLLPLLLHYYPLHKSIDVEHVKKTTADVEQDLSLAKARFAQLHKAQPHTILALDFATNVHRAVYKSGLKPVSNMIYNYCFYNERLGNTYLNNACERFYESLQHNQPDIIIYSIAAWPVDLKNAKDYARAKPAFWGMISSEYLPLADRENYVLFIRKKLL